MAAGTPLESSEDPCRVTGASDRCGGWGLVMDEIYDRVGAGLEQLVPLVKVDPA